MRSAAALLVAAGLATSARADPPPTPVGADVGAAMQQVRAGIPGGRATLERLAQSGRADAAEAWGEMLQFGVGVPQDRKLACNYFAMASGKRGDATHNHAFCYEDGVIGGQSDIPRAAQLYEVAAKLGYAKANCALGNLLIAGQGGLPQDMARGVALCRVAAEAGVADAQTDLGNLLLQGKGVAKDAIQARSWYEKAIAQRHANAAYTLGQIYWFGDGVPKDNVRSAELWHLAWEWGRVDAAYELGNEAFVRAKRGDKVWDPAGLDEAAAWYAKAVEAPNPETRKKAIERRDLSLQLAGAMRRRQ